MKTKNKTNYKIDGKGKNIILIHGLSDNLEYWEPLTQTLKNKYKIIRYDLRGHGKTPQDNKETTIEQYVEDLNNLINTLNINKTTLIGFSLGGIIAQRYTTKYPEKVTKLILMSTFQQCTPHITTILEKLKKAIHNSFEEFYDEILPMVLCPEIIMKNQKELEIIKEYQTQKANTEAIEEAITAILNFDKPLQVNRSTLILSGQYDNFIPLSTQIAMHDKIDNSEFILIENVKHNLLIGENISHISTIIDNFLSK